MFYWNKNGLPLQYLEKDAAWAWTYTHPNTTTGTKENRTCLG
jgi:hypothetical protein